MVAIALLLAVACYAGAAALAFTPFARPVGPPFRGVVIALALGVLAHAAAMAAATHFAGGLPVWGLGPALSFAGLAFGVALLLTELLARDVTLTLIGGPLAAIMTAIAINAGWRPFGQPRGAQGAWLASHVAFSFIGIAALATAAGRQLGGWRARRAAVAATLAFAVVVASYVAARVVEARPGQFL
jgi:ABC-type uncharacterized transport system permease subunit